MQRKIQVAATCRKTATNGMHGWPAYPSTDASLSDNLVEGIERQDPAFYCRSHGQGHGCHVEMFCSYDGE